MVTYSKLVIVQNAYFFSQNDDGEHATPEKLENGHEFEFVTSKKRQRANLPDARHPILYDPVSPHRTRNEDTEPFCSRYANFDIVRGGREKKRKEKKKKREKRGGGRVLRDRGRSIFKLIGAISRISNFFPTS